MGNARTSGWLESLLGGLVWAISPAQDALRFAMNTLETWRGPTGPWAALTERSFQVFSAL